MDGRLKEIIGTGTCIADLGCGSGQLLVNLKDAFERRIGLDVSPRRLEEMSGSSAGWEFRVADLNKEFPMAADSVDAVIANQAIEHIIDPERFCEEIYRILRPGGRGVITTPNIRYVKNLAHMVLTGYGPRTAGGNTLDGSWDDGHVHYFTHRDLRELLGQVGFSNIRSAALIGTGAGNLMRRLMDRHASAWLVRELLSGNILVWFEK
ncbi:MAG: class I SAM-dependent methyltransferase [Nitrosospira sp.]|nr:class I SAM-dependent methyltransferase [Nitrosospira sp.]